MIAEYTHLARGGRLAETGFGVVGLKWAGGSSLVATGVAALLPVPKMFSLLSDSIVLSLLLVCNCWTSSKEGISIRVKLGQVSLSLSLP